MAKSVLPVGGLSRDPDPDQRGDAGNEVKRRIGQTAEHGRRSGSPGCPALEADEQRGDSGAGQRGAAVERGICVIGGVSGSVHG